MRQVVIKFLVLIREDKMATEKVKKVQELRRSNAATPIPSKKKYTRKTKHKKEKYLKTYCDLVAPFFN
jgi:hypothetical protein